MKYYYINKNAQENGDHEVHTAGCPHPPKPTNRIALGAFLTCQQAVSAAKNKWPKTRINGCYYCSNACHTS